MAQKLSAENSARVRQALASWQQWQPCPEKLPELVEQLGGDSNLSFKVDDGLSQWVLRLNNPNKDSGINRANERLAIEAAHAKGLSPQLCFSGDDFLVTPFVQGKSPLLKNFSQFGQLFSHIHSLPVELASIDLLDHLKNYYQKVPPDSLLATCYQHLVATYPADSVELKPCHNDCLLPNMLETGKGIFLLDWEYAAAVDPAYDLAVFTTSYALSPDQMDSLLAGYDPRLADTRSLRLRITYYEKYYRLIEILWWRIRKRPMREQLQLLTDSLTR
ncbi:MAG: phosphotransferase [Pseudohongiellaceae bacterium]